jgi:hypothetical protein
VTVTTPELTAAPTGWRGTGPAARAIGPHLGRAGPTLGSRGASLDSDPGGGKKSAVDAFRFSAFGCRLYRLECTRQLRISRRLKVSALPPMIINRYRSHARWPPVNLPIASIFCAIAGCSHASTVAPLGRVPNDIGEADQFAIVVMYRGERTDTRRRLAPGHPYAPRRVIISKRPWRPAPGYEGQGDRDTQGENDLRVRHHRSPSIYMKKVSPTLATFRRKLVVS